MLKKTIAILGFIASTANAAVWSERIHTDSFNSDNNRTTYSIKSDNSVNFSFPYNGGSTLTIVLHKFQKNDKRSAALVISKGQFNCSIVDGCIVQYKVDNGPIQTVRMYVPTDGSTDYLGAGADAKQFGRNIINAKKIEIRVNFFQEGSRDFVFNPTN